MASPAKGAAPRLPDLDTVYTINPDGSRNVLTPADVHGKWLTLRRITYAFLIVIYLSLPFIPIGGHPAVHIDIPGRQAFLFGETFTNQDFYLMFFLLTGLGFGLFMATALYGRVWCGYACPQTVFLEGVFRTYERLVEGSREQRLRRRKRPGSFDNVWRVVVKHAGFLVFSALIAHAFLAYFLPVKELLAAVRHSPLEHWTAFLWTTVSTALVYFDNAWFREQLCLIVCPYGRIQSALTDADTVVIGYDEKRGEPRSKKTSEGGDCIDCKRCVAVCPTGIDIRNGLQMECIGCAQCIDACDEIMEKVDRPKGLIRYDSRRGFDEGRRRSLARPRVFVYVALALVGITVASFSFAGRTEFEARVLRPRGLPYQLDEARIRNVFTLRIQNKTDEERSYSVAVPENEAGIAVEAIVSQKMVVIPGLADHQVPIVLYAERADYPGSFPLTFEITDTTTGRTRSVDVRFRGP